MEKLENLSHGHFFFENVSDSLFVEQDKAGTWNTFVPFFADMRRLCKKINNAKDAMTFSIQMNYIAGYGLLLQVIVIATNSTAEKLPFNSVFCPTQYHLLISFMLCVFACQSVAKYALPYLETGTDWNLTCMLFTLLQIVRTGGKNLPSELNVLTDGGDGNWSVATCCFYGMLVHFGVFKIVTVHRLPPGHTHRKADGYISYFSRWRWGSCNTRGQRGTR